MSANGISTLSTKQLKQVAKLNYDQRKRQGYQVSNTNGSVSFNGTSQYLTVADAVPLRLVSATAWTIECWIYYTGSGSGSILVKDGVQGVNVPAYELNVSSGYVRGTVSSVGTAQQILTSSTLLPTSAWTHIAFVLNSGTYTLYQNGVSVATAAVVQTVGNFSPGALYIAYQDSGSAGAYISANISNVRIVKGTALYTTAFTPPSNRLPLVANTSLLLNTVYGSNFLVDSSSNAYTVTNNGTATSSSFSPTTTNTADTSANFYRAANTLDINLLPTKYTGNAITDNANTGGLVKGRPWSTSNPDTAITVITTSTTGAQLILNLDSRNTNSLARGASPGTWYDLTSNHNDATIYGSVAYGTVGGQSCAVFPGGDANYAQCVPNVYFSGGSFTIQSWVYVTAVGNWNRIIDFGRGAGSNNILLSNTYGTTGKPGLYVEGTQFQSTLAGSSTVLLNAWHQVCATFQYTSGATGTATIYVDGVAQGTGTVPQPVNITRTLCYIGKSNWGNPPDPNMQGGIGAIQIYDGYLTSAEMLSNYNTTKSYYGL